MDNATYYTQNNGTVYAITVTWPVDNLLLLSYPVPSATTQVFMFGYDTPLNYKYSPGNGKLFYW